ncbi:sensor domain-containing protein [Magnetofaba australis]|uniref:Putative PAS/PAC sensor-containing diguanylate cyclase/phosphodiesterase n=1 Tax=Magnetofaba australis IT-1 TaxID=1434232 RepID=A0A1Y2K187_9PROT|nr:EAL domain-containing protein [Magnetofaba australis]OSM01768.1 putative PAS/PAC sensor-containing diguanylate cyclase/phosphodiesterase [Magnetofaba australis IT-1]
MASHVNLLRDASEENLPATLKNMQQALPILDIVKTIILAIDRKGRIIYLNPTGHQLLGHEIGALIGRDWFDVAISPNRRQQTREALARIVRDNTELNHYVEHDVVCADGRMRLIAWHNTVVREADGEVCGVFCSGADITDQRDARIALRMADLSINSAREAIFWLTEEGRIHFINAAAAVLLGRPRGQLVDMRLSELEEGLDEAGWQARWERLQQSGSWTLEGLWRNARGVGVPVESNAAHIRFEGVDYALVVARDIRQRRDAEEKLHTVAQTFHQAMMDAEDHVALTRKAFASAIEGVVVVGADGYIESVNPAFTEITGYSAEEALDSSPALLHHDHHGQGFFNAMWEEIERTGSWVGEVWNRRRDGESFPQRLALTAIRGSDGEINHYVAVIHDMTELRRSEQELHMQTFYDALTGLPNRSLFKDRLAHSLRQASRMNEQMAILFVNLDLFKKINDSLGHACGDELLRLIAGRFKSRLRDGDTACRLGGDEFAVLIENLEQAQDAVMVTQKLFDAVEQPFQIRGHEAHITLSVGISLYPADGEDAEALLRTADMAMTRAKQAGRNNFQFYTAAMDTQALERLRIENQLRHALVNEEFVLHYQPKVELSSGRVVSMEALVRWQKPDGAMVPPGVFIPVAEETALIGPMGDWILRAACLQTRQWVESGYDHLRVAVNISARQFQQRDFVQQVQAVLEDTGLNPRHLELEITESLMMVDVEQAIESLSQLKALGLCMSVDDFGTGYSSLSYLKRFPIHALKIDQSFVREITTDADDAAIVSAIVSMAHNLNLEVVAEGVETAEHLEFLKKLQCEEIQGYYFSKPLDAKAFTELLKSGRSL